MNPEAVRKMSPDVIGKYLGELVEKEMNGDVKMTYAQLHRRLIKEYGEEAIVIKFLPWVYAQESLKLTKAEESTILSGNGDDDKI